jgi:hypothetical protein
MKKALKVLDKDIQPGPTTKAELAAYAAVLDDLFSNIKKTEKEAFFLTSEDFGIDNPEKAAGYSDKSMPLELRRQKIKKRLSITENHFNKQGIIDFLLCAGINAQIEEDPAHSKLKIILQKTQNHALKQAELAGVVSKILPAHLDYEVVRQ